MNDLLRPYLWKFVLVFFYYIMIYSSTFSDYLHHLEVVLDLLQSNYYFVKLFKCVYVAD